MMYRLASHRAIVSPTSLVSWAEREQVTQVPIAPSGFGQVTVCYYFKQMVTSASSGHFFQWKDHDFRGCYEPRELAWPRHCASNVGALPEDAQSISISRTTSTCPNGHRRC